MSRDPKTSDPQEIYKHMKELDDEIQARAAKQRKSRQEIQAERQQDKSN